MDWATLIDALGKAEDALHDARDRSADAYADTTIERALAGLAALSFAARNAPEPERPQGPALALQIARLNAATGALSSHPGSSAMVASVHRLGDALTHLHLALGGDPTTPPWP